MVAATARLGLQYPTGSDINNFPSDMQRLAQALDTVAMVYLEGPASARPPAGTHGRVYFGTDNGAAYYDWGAGWIQLNANPIPSIVTAAGDLIVGSGAGTVTNLPVGAEGQALVSSAGLGNGIGWADVAGMPKKTNGALASARFVGGTAQGPPTGSGYLAGDFAVDQTGELWICYQGGATPQWRPAHGPALGQPATIPGAGAATRFVGGTTSGPPTQGVFFTGDFVIDQQAAIWVCTSGGSPGTWVGLIKHGCYTSFQSVAQLIFAEIWTDLMIDTVVIDTEHGHGRHSSHTSYRCRRKGTYRITGAIAFEGLITIGGGVGCRVTYNGDPIIGTVSFVPAIVSGFNCVSAHPVEIELDIDDEITVQGWHPATSGQNTSVDQPDVRCRFSVTQLR